MQSNRRLNSEKFQNFRFEPKVAIFDEKSQIMKTRDFQEFTLHVIFMIFLKMINPIIAIFVRNFKNHT